MLDKQYVSRRLLPIIVAFTLAFGCITVIQRSESYADEPTLLVQGNITSDILFTAYSDNTFVISGTGEIPNFSKWTDYKKVVNNNLLATVKKVIIEEGVSSIGMKAFFYSSKYCFKTLETIELPSTLESIGNNAFGGDINNGISLKEIVFKEPSGLRSIGQNAFMGCTSLEEVIIPEGVTTIQDYAFQGCSSLKNISFPSTITTYGVSVLYGCTEMKTITFNAMEASPLNYERDEVSGGDYAGFDSYIYNATNPASLEGCLRKSEGHDVIMRHPVGAKGYSDDDPTPTDGWKYYVENTWETFSNIPEEVRDVIDAIDAIGVVTEDNYLDKESAVTTAKDLYDALESQELKDQVSNYDTLTAAEASIASFKLAAAKTKAKGELDTLLVGKNEADYDADDWTALTKAISDGKDAIDAATTTDGVNVAKSVAENAVSAIKTKEQKAAEELAAAKTKAKGELDTLLVGKNEADYDADDWTALIKAISDGKDAIDAATTTDGVNEAKSATENTVAAIKTKKQKAAEKAEKVKKQKATAKKYTVKGLKVKAKSRKFTVSWKKTKGATGYEVQYKLKSAKRFKTLKALKKMKVTTKKFKKGKKYQFRVRTYTKINGEKIYGKWTKAKTVKCK